MQTIDSPEALATLYEVVESAGPEYVYTKRPFDTGGPACVYVDPDTDEPSCGVGRALARLGVPIRVLARLDQTMSSGISHPGVLGTLEEAGFDLTRDAVSVFEIFQTYQDLGTAWGACLNHARTGL